MDFLAFHQDDKTFSAVVRKLEIIGEATKKVSDATKEAYPDVPWRAAAGMRDRLIHAYFEVEAKIVWATVHDSLPPYRGRIVEILEQRAG